jgi:hypothetical protein
MRSKLNESPQAEVLKKALGEKKLCAFVFAPVINPLNNKVVGAEYHIPKATVRFISWEDTSAEVWVQDEYAPIESSDVASVLHTWEKREAKPVANERASAWWTITGENGKAQITAVPPKKDAPWIEIGSQVQPHVEGQTFAFDVVRPPPESLPVVASPNPPINPLPSSVPVGNSARAIVNFITLHHQKSSNRDVDGMMADYAERVEHFKAGVVDRAYIRAEEEEYHAPGYTISERLRGAVRLSEVEHDRVLAEYELQFLRVGPDASWTKGAADVTLEIQTTPQGLRIVKQNSVSRENEKQKGRGNPPSL